MHLKPHLLMITWQEADRTTNVHVYDFETGEAHAVVVTPTAVWSAQGAPCAEWTDLVWTVDACDSEVKTA